jgi:hypothetical protein
LGVGVSEVYLQSDEQSSTDRLRSCLPRGLGIYTSLASQSLNSIAPSLHHSPLRRKLKFFHFITLSVPNSNTHFTLNQLHFIKPPTYHHHQTRTSKCASPSCLSSPQHSSLPKHLLSPWTPSPPMTATKGSTAGVGTGKLLWYLPPPSNPPNFFDSRLIFFG